MASSLSTTTDPRASIAVSLWRAAMISLAVMPVGMAIAHRSSPVYVVLSAALCLAAAALEGRLQSVLRELWSALRSPLGLATLVFFAWCLLSIGWSEFRGLSFRAFGEFWLPIAAALVLGLTLPKHINPNMFWLFLGAYLLSGVMIVGELQTGMVLRRALGVRYDTFIFNRPVLTLLTLLLPLSAWIMGGMRRGWLVQLALVLFVGLVALRSESDAAVLGLAIVCLTLPVAWFAPRLTIALATFSFLAAVCLAPVIGSIGARLISPEVHKMIASSHSKERVEIWQSFGEVVRRQPLVGSGFGVSPRMPDTAVAKELPKELRPALDIGHPHNAVLQIWVELGAVGAIIFLVIAFLILRALWRLPHLTRSAALALMAGAAPVALVGHGAWQGWWAASLGAAIIWMQAASRFQTETKS
ncbi:MAG TPA: O-antigen ligase family protein [Microvirga sp.]|nr:O-antigen ligase family protein [Microvirga sp.]